MKHRQLGAFRITGELGRGGMGVVYRGVHANGTPVALKVVAAKYAQTEQRRLEFRREVHAMARLNHPNIATVFDTGMTGGGDGARPWYAMELVEGTPLSRSVLTGDWSQLKGLLLGLLDALAHAHARGLIHRDIKPGNVLVSYGDRELHATLVDFGIAHALYLDDQVDDADSDLVTGTPNYMAPEQITGQWRDQGPWTDLYALGCLVWRLVCGSAPFERGSSEETLRSQLSDEPPGFEPRFEVPDALDPWLRTLLAKSPAHRFRRAADAAFALLRMPAVEPSMVAPPAADEASASRTIQLPTLASIAETIADEPTLALDAADAPASSPAALRRWPKPMLPPNWKRLSADVEPKQLTGAGLGLFGVREIPVVGRVPIRKTMWGLLKHVHSHKRPHALVLRGPAGCGKTRLCEWLARRAHETGAATVLEARHAPHGGPMEGLGAMLRRFFRADGLDYHEILERVRQFQQSNGSSPDLRLYDAVILTQAICAQQGVSTGSSRSPQNSRSKAAPEEQLDALVRFFDRLATERPVLLQIDDAQWADQTLALIERMLDVDEPLPLLVVATARDEAQQVSERLLSLSQHPRCDLRELGALPESSQRTLVKRLLGLTDETVAHVVERSQGNPLFAVQLLDDWVEQGVLTAAEGGFMPTAPFEDALPDGPIELWRRRIDHLIGSLEPHWRETARAALEGAALLGQHIGHREWRALCERVGLTNAAALVEAMATRNLAQSSADGWSFRHGGLCDSLERIAARTGRLAARHRVCADLLEEVYGPRHPQASLRVAHHLYEAGEYERALPVLSMALERSLYEGDLATMAGRLEVLEELLDRLEVPRVSPQRCKLLALRCWIQRRMGLVDEAISSIEAALAMCDGVVGADTAGFVHAMKGILLKELGRYTEAKKVLATALGFFGPNSDQYLRARALAILAIILRSQGRLDESIDGFEKALTACHAAEDAVLQARIETEVGYCEFSRGNNPAAIEYFEQARSGLAQTGRSQSISVVENNLGDLARHEGRWDDARQHYQLAIELSRDHRDYGNPVARLNFALLEIGQGHWKEARAPLEELDAFVQRVGQGQMLPHIRLGLAGCALEVGDQAGFRRHYEWSVDAVAADDVADKDLAWLAERLGSMAQERRWHEDAAALLRLAQQQYDTLGDEARREQLGARLQPTC